jgi:hypothetical protein
MILSIGSKYSFGFFPLLIRAKRFELNVDTTMCQPLRCLTYILGHWEQCWLSVPSGYRTHIILSLIGFVYQHHQVVFTSTAPCRNVLGQLYAEQDFGACIGGVLGIIVASVRSNSGMLYLSDVTIYNNTLSRHVLPPPGSRTPLARASIVLLQASSHDVAINRFNATDNTVVSNALRTDALMHWLSMGGGALEVEVAEDVTITESTFVGNKLIESNSTANWPSSFFHGVLAGAALQIGDVMSHGQGSTLASFYLLENCTFLSNEIYATFASAAGAAFVVKAQPMAFTSLQTVGICGNCSFISNRIIG